LWGVLGLSGLGFLWGSLLGGPHRVGRRAWMLGRLAYQTRKRRSNNQGGRKATGSPQTLNQRTGEEPEGRSSRRFITIAGGEKKRLPFCIRRWGYRKEKQPVKKRHREEIAKGAKLSPMKDPIPPSALKLTVKVQREEIPRGSKKKKTNSTNTRKKKLIPPIREFWGDWPVCLGEAESLNAGEANFLKSKRKWLLLWEMTNTGKGADRGKTVKKK